MMTRLLRTCFALVAGTLAAASAAHAQVTISSARATNVGTTALTVVWSTSAPSTPDLDVFTDAGATQEISATLGLEFFPVQAGDASVVNNYAARVARRTLQGKTMLQQAVAVRVTGLTPDTTYYLRPRSFDSGGQDNAAAPAQLVAVRTARLTSLVTDARLLSVRFTTPGLEGAVAVLNGPAGTLPLSAVIGDSAPADTAVFPLSDLVYAATGTNAFFFGPTDITLFVLGKDAPAGATQHTITFGTQFIVAGPVAIDSGTPTPAPLFTLQPSSVAVLAGQTAIFSAEASGTPAPTYQWQVKPAGSDTWTNLANTGAYSGATSTQLLVGPTTTGMGGDQFRCIADNGVPPAATSAAATLTIGTGAASISLSNLNQVYGGAPRSVTVTTVPAGLAATVTYDGSTTAPINAGSYAVLATITAPGYTGATSGTLNIAKAPQTITFPAIGDRAFGEPAFPLNASASSGLPVTFEVVSGPATLSGNLLTITAQGTITVRAAQSGNANYAAAAPVERIFAASKSVATVTLGSLSQVYTGTGRSATATTSPAGLAVTFTYDGAVTPPVAVGSYAVVGTIQDANYSGSATGTLTITKASLIARADNKSRPQGTANPALTITYVGLLGADTPASINTPPSISTTATDASAAGSYPITLSGGSDETYTLTLQNGTLTITPVDVLTAPAINTQPASVTVAVGATAAFTVEAGGTAPLAYQWFKNGDAIPGATAATLTITNVQRTDEGSYSVRVTNTVGQAVSRIATLTVPRPANAPVILDEPDDIVVKQRAKAVLRVSAAGDPTLTYQWRKGATNIAGATTPKLVIENVRPADEGQYSVVVTNPHGTATSRSATLTVRGKSHRGTYFGRFSDGGHWACDIDDDNFGLYCGFARGAKIPFLSRRVACDDEGRFRFNSGALAQLRPAGIASIASAGPQEDPGYLFDLLIGDDGTISGTVGGLGLSVTGNRTPETGPTEALSGLYEAGASESGSVSYTFVGSTGEVYVATLIGDTIDTGLGTISTGGAIVVTTEAGAAVTGSVDASTSVVATTVTTTSGAVSFTGANNDARDDLEKLINISTRGPVQTGSGLMIAGFVIQGDQPKRVLVRAVGPTLGSRFGVPGSLSSVHLDLFKGATLLASADDWAEATNAGQIIDATRLVGGFQLATNSSDAAVLLTLTPGSYTVHVSGRDGATGVSLVEVYDATEGDIAPDQRVMNISTRGFVGAGGDVQIAGFSINGSVPKRVLIRGIGPGLSRFGVTGVLTDPHLRLFNAAGQSFATNDNWAAAPNAADIQTVAAQVHAFSLAADGKDAVLLVSLAPGIYTVHLSGVDGGTGVGLIEVYDVD
jgi:hypothetical protein